MNFEKYLPSLFRQSIIVFYKTIVEFDEIIDYLDTEMGAYISFIARKNGWATVMFNDCSVVRIYDIKSLDFGFYNYRWTSIMVTSGCTKEDIEMLNKSPLLGFIYGSYANENIMRITEPRNIFVGATPVKYEKNNQ